MSLRFTAIEAGESITPLTLPPISRGTLALYAGASGDINPIHIDSDVAKARGFPDVFAHGMLVMAYAGRCLVQWASPGTLREFSARFVSVTALGDALVCSGRVTDKRQSGQRQLVCVEFAVTNQAGALRVQGDALIEC